MNFFVVTCFLVLTLNFISIDALKCYECADCENIGKNPPNDCLAGQDVCMGTSLKYFGKSFSTKMCSFSTLCKPFKVGLFGVGFSVDCCNTDGCNLSNSVTIKRFSLYILFVCLIISLVRF